MNIYWMASVSMWPFAHFTWSHSHPFVYFCSLPANLNFLFFFLHEHLSGKTRNKVKKSKRENQISKRWMQNKRQNKLEFVFQKRRVLGHICEALRYFIRDTVYKFLGFFLWTAYCQRRFYCTTNSKVSLKFVWLKKWRLVLFLRCFAVRMEKFSQRSLDGVN